MIQGAGLRRQWKIKEQRRNWFIIWLLIVCGWIWYHSLMKSVYSRQPPSQMQYHPNGSHSCTNQTCVTFTTRLELQGKGSRSCATVEEMGASITANTRAQDLVLRRMINEFLREHGAQRVRELPSEQLCQRSFVYGRSNENGFGNEMYKILTAAGLALMLNRSLIVGEDSSTNPGYFGLGGNVHFPFGDYIIYSNESFTMAEVKRLWVLHNCSGKYKRPLTMRIDSIQRLSGTYALCDDWRKWSNPIIWFHGAQDAVALQLFLKNMHPEMRMVAGKILGDSLVPSTRGNLYGELMRALIFPRDVIEDAVRWTLGGGREPDIAIHLRMLNSRSGRTIQAACSCIRTMLAHLMVEGTPRVFILTDTPSVISVISNSLERFAQVLYFDYELYMNSSADLHNVMAGNSVQPPRKRMTDWGPLPRWVALVDFFLASRAKYGVISAGKRVATTYAQLVASLAASNTLGERVQHDFKFFSSFPFPLLQRGLSQRGWGYAWRTFSGSHSCSNQTSQCAQTPLLPYAWWDGPWQRPTSRDVQLMRNLGIGFNSSGMVREQQLVTFCKSRTKSRVNVVKLLLPPCSKLKTC